MTEFRFDHLQSVKTPDNWIEDAINIPKKNKKPLPFFFRPYIIGSAAAFCIILAVVVSLMFHSGTSSPLPSRPHFPVNGYVESTAGTDDSKEPTAPTEAVVVTNPQGEPIATYYVPASQPTDSAKHNRTQSRSSTLAQGTAPADSSKTVDSSAVPTAAAPQSSAATQPTAVPQTLPDTQPVTIPQTIPDTQATISPEEVLPGGEVDDDYSVFIIARKGSDYFNLGYCYVQFIQENGWSSAPVKKVELRGSGKTKTALLNVEGFGLKLKPGERFTLRISDEKGNYQSKTLCFTNTNILEYFI